MVAPEGVKTVIFKVSVIISNMERIPASSFRETAENGASDPRTCYLRLPCDNLPKFILELPLPGEKLHLSVTQSTHFIQYHPPD